MADLAGPLPRLAHAPFADAEHHRTTRLGDRVAHRGVGRFGVHARGLAPVVFDVIDVPARIGTRILILVAAAAGTAAAGGRAGVRVDAQLESLAMHIVRQRLHAGWEALGVGLDVAVGVALALPAIVNVHVLEAGVLQARLDHGIGGLADQSLVDIAGKFVPAVPAHLRGAGQAFSLLSPAIAAGGGTQQAA